MIKCQLHELHRTVKALSVLLGVPVVTIKHESGVEQYFVNNSYVGVEKGLTKHMLDVVWEERYKSDQCYVKRVWLDEAEKISMTDAQLERMYQHQVMRNKRCS